MCGILAVIDRGDRDPRSEAAFNQALDLLKHRGPDDRGAWEDRHAWLGHRRLAIIDLSPGGHQPMVDADTGMVVTFNGEIFNYIELRDELRALGHVFRTESDTEVLLRAYIAWGEDCLARFNGMWHFVIWNPRKKTAFVARDRIGEKPCYYSLESGRLIVASEPKAILALQPSHRKVDKAALFAFLVRSELYSRETSFYEGIKTLKPAYCATFNVDTGAFIARRYWDLSEIKEASPSDADLDNLAALISDAVRLRMRSDVPVGLTLSGGLDSTTILTEAAKHVPRLIAFTSSYEGGGRDADESKWARMAVSNVPNAELHPVNTVMDDWLATLHRIVWHMDGPGYSPAVFPLWRIMETARKEGVPVVLEGQGADELLAGYVQYAALDAIGALSKAFRWPSVSNWSTVTQALNSYSRTFTPKAFGLRILRERFGGLLPIYRARYGTLGTLRSEFIAEDRYLPTATPNNMDVRARLLNDLQSEILPGLLQYGDAVSMAHSIENRLPFVDHRLVELCVSLPMGSKVSNGETKSVLRKVLHQAGQHEIAERRDKRGYPTPVNAWLAANNGQIARQVLLNPRARIHEFCEPRGLSRLIDMHTRGVMGTGAHLYRLISTEVWMNECLVETRDKPLSEDARARSRLHLNTA